MSRRGNKDLLDESRRGNKDLLDEYPVNAAPEAITIPNVT